MEKILSQYTVSYTKTNDLLLEDMLFIKRSYNPDSFILFILDEDDDTLNNLHKKFFEYFNNRHIEFDCFKSLKYNLKLFNTYHHLTNCSINHEFTIYYKNGFYIYNLEYLDYNKKNKWLISDDLGFILSIGYKKPESLSNLKQNLKELKYSVELNKTQKLLKSNNEFIKYLLDMNYYLVTSQLPKCFNSRNEALDFAYNYDKNVSNIFNNLTKEKQDEIMNLYKFSQGSKISFTKK